MTTREFTREEIYAKLKEGIVNIHFTKKDGTPRMLQATWNETYLPDLSTAKKALDESKKEDKPKDYCAVWDMSVKDWRSFRFDSVYRIGDEQVTYGKE